MAKKVETPPKEPPPFKRDEDLNIYQRVNLIMAETEKLQKLKEVDGGNFSYNVITSDQVTAQVQPLLVKHGVVLVPSVIDWGVVEPEPQINPSSGKRYPYRTEATVRVRWVNADNDQDFFEADWFGFGIDSQDKGPGKATTYAIRYAMIKTLQIPSGDKDVEDGNDDSPTGKTTKAAKKYKDGPPKTGGGKKADPGKIINEKQVDMIKAVMSSFECPNEPVGEWLAKFKDAEGKPKVKFEQLTNAEMDHILFMISDGKKGKELKQ